MATYWSSITEAVEFTDMVDMKNKSELDIRHLRAGDLAELYGLHSHIAEVNVDRAAYRLRPIETYRVHLAEQGITIGALHHGKLVAFAILRFADEEDNLGPDVGLVGDELGRVAHLEECAVDPDYRGWGLQYDLTSRRIRIAESLGYRHLCITVAPTNSFSLNNSLRHGLAVRDLKLKYEGVLRFVLYRDLAKQEDVETAMDEVFVEINNHEELRRYLSQGWTGVALDKGREVLRLVK